MPKLTYVKPSIVAKRFGITLQGVYELIRRKKIAAIKLSGTRVWRIATDEMDRYEEECYKRTKRDYFPNF